MVDVWWVVYGMKILLGELWLGGYVVGGIVASWLCCWGKVNGQETYGASEEALCSWG